MKIIMPDQDINLFNTIIVSRRLLDKHLLCLSGFILKERKLNLYKEKGFFRSSKIKI